MSEFLSALFEFFSAIGSADKSLSENSRLGESPMGREARRSWVRLGLGCIVLVLLGALAVLGGCLLLG